MNLDARRIKVDDAWSVVAEHYPDALLIVRDGKFVRWRSTNETWALGATKQYQNSVLKCARLQVEESFYGGEG